VGVEFLYALGGLTEEVAGVLDPDKVLSGVRDVVVVELGVDEDGDAGGEGGGDIVETQYLIEIAVGGSGGNYGLTGKPSINDSLKVINDDGSTLVGALGDGCGGLSGWFGNVDLDGFLDASVILKGRLCDRVQNLAGRLANNRIHLLEIVKGPDCIFVGLLDMGLKTKLNGFDIGLSIFLDGGEGVQGFVDDVIAVGSRFNVIGHGVDTIADKRKRSDATKDTKGSGCC
jgi:hypothetical protein